MKTEIICGAFRRTVEAPPETDIIGVSVHRGDKNYSTVYIDKMDVSGFSRTDEDIIIDDNTTVTVHFYRMPCFSDIFAEFIPFRSMRLAEIEDGDIHICQTL